MSEKTDEEDDLEFQQADAGLLFRTEMWVTNAFLGYWPYLLGGVVVILLCFLLYGQYSAWVVSDQRASSQAIYEQIDDLPSLERIGPGRAFGQALPEGTDLAERASKLEEVAEESRATARVEALLKAAELYRLADDAEAQRKVLEKAEGDANGVLAYGVQTSLANLELEAGDGDAAITRLRKLADRSDALGQQATLDLGRALETLDRDEEARKVYENFEEQWPDSSRLDEVRERKKAVAG
ncbi:MAG: tetratricopeptide repeat protein [Myxococcota bacterium]